MAGRSRWRIGAVIGLLLGITATDVAAGECYYVMVFASQSHPKLPRFTHTWATFVRAVGEGGDPNAYAIQAHTVSWLPAAIAIRPWNPCPETGSNLDLYQTLAIVMSQGEQITMWGPFVIDGPTYQHSLDVASFFASGAPRYRGFSTRHTKPIYNCITAVGALGMGIDEGLFPSLQIGYPSGRHFVRQFMARSPHDQTAADHSWLIARLALDRYPIAVVPPWQVAACTVADFPSRCAR